MSRKSGGHTLTGPETDRGGYPSPLVALSAAITYAGRHGAPCTFYVRDEQSECVGRVERDDNGDLLVLGSLQLAAERERSTAAAPFVPGA